MRIFGWSLLFIIGALIVGVASLLALDHGVFQGLFTFVILFTAYVSFVNRKTKQWVFDESKAETSPNRCDMGVDLQTAFAGGAQARDPVPAAPVEHPPKLPDLLKQTRHSDLLARQGSGGPPCHCGEAQPGDSRPAAAGKTYRLVTHNTVTHVNVMTQWLTSDELAKTFGDTLHNLRQNPNLRLSMTPQFDLRITNLNERQAGLPGFKDRIHFVEYPLRPRITGVIF